VSLHWLRDLSLGGLVGEQMVNVLEVNLELRKRYGEPAGATS